MAVDGGDKRPPFPKAIHKLLLPVEYLVPIAGRPNGVPGMPNMTFAVENAATCLQKLAWETAHLESRQNERAPYDELSYLSINAAGTAWHAGVWVYAELSRDEKNQLREMLQHNDGADAAEHFVGAVSRAFRDLQLCRGITLQFKHHTPTRGKIVAAPQHTASSVGSTVLHMVTTYTTATAEAPTVFRIPKIVDGETRHRVPALLTRVHSFWEQVLKNPVPTIAALLAAGPEVAKAPEA